MNKPTKTLDDYQVEAYEFLVGRKFAGLFDAPGIGKTGPAIMAGVARGLAVNRPVLVTCPAYLIPQWKEEIHAFAPGALVYRADGKGYEARVSVLSSSEPDFILTSYNNWSAQGPEGYQYVELTKNQFAAYIFDEGHRLRGRNSAWTKHVLRTRLSKSPNLDTPIWLLTGTPFVRDGGDFFVPFHLYDKKRFRSYWRFVEDRCIVTKSPWKTDVGNIKRSYQDEFRKELAEFSLRRTTKDIPQLADLEYVEVDYFVPTDPSVIKMMKTAKKEYILEHASLDRSEYLSGSGAMYVALRKLATDPPTVQKPKVDWLKDFLTDKKGKVVVYTWFKDSARMVTDALGSQAVGPVSGDLAAGKRMELVDEWRRSKGPQVLVATISALKEGISLTEAADVVFVEHTELPGDMEQCIKRLCRRGQKQVVQVHHLWGEKTIDIATMRVLDGRSKGITEALTKWIELDEEETEDEWFV